MANGTYAPDPVFTGWDSNGDPLSGGKLFTYAAGTTTKVTTWTDIPMTAANTNPVILNSAGRATVVLLPGVSYKFVLAPAADTDPPASPVWTRDLISAVPPTGLATDLDVTGTAGEAISINDACYLSDGSGGLTAGRWYRTDSDQTYSSVQAGELAIAPAAISTGASGTFRLSGRITGLSGLTAGALQYIAASAGNLTGTAPANARLIAVADSTTSVVVGPWVGTMLASATVGGVLSAGAQEIGGTKSFMDPPLFAPGQIATADATVSGVISRNVTPVGNVGAGTDDLMSMTLLANTLNVAGKMVRVTAWGITANTAGNKTVIFNLGTDALTMAPANAYQDQFWEVVVVLVRLTSTTTRVWTRFTYVTLASGTVGNIMFAATFTVNVTTGDHALKLTAISAGAATDDVVQSGMIVEVVG